MSDVRLGYEVGTGAEVRVPVAHMVVAGQTQLSGKTTTLEGLVSRAPVRGYAFVTKRGEQSFAKGHRVAPYLRERADWRFVQSVLEATMHERMKFERAWIMRASKGAKTLADVQRNVRAALADKKVKGLNADVYLTLDAYLDIVVPKLATVRFADTLELHPGLNVIDMADRNRFPPELQSLVIRSTIEFIYEVCQDTVAIIPEAWEWLPQSRGSPVKLAAVELVRKGAGLKNFVWLDSQDIGGVDKELLRSCSVWLLGVQREANEIKRTLANVPAGISKPKPSDIATLERGQFFACWGRHVVKTYAQPAWMSDETARGNATFSVASIAATQREREAAMPPEPPTPFASDVAREVDAAVLRQSALLEDHELADVRSRYWREFNEAGDKRVDEIVMQTLVEQAGTEEDDEMTEDQEKKLDAVLTGIQRLVGQVGSLPPGTTEVPDQPGVYRTELPAEFDEEALYQRFKSRLAKEAPSLIRVLTLKPELHVIERTGEVELDGSTLRGRLARLVADGFFDEPKTGNSAFNELKRVGFPTAKPNVYRECDALTGMGFMTKEPGGYRAVEGMKRNIKRKSAA